MYIYLHTHHEGVYVCVHIGVGFGVACSELKAIPEPREAEQQQCRSRFFVVLKSGTQSLITAFYIPVYQQLKTQYGTLTTME